jgi:hypothetical protein
MSDNGLRQCEPVPAEEGQVIIATIELTDEQKTWPRVRIVPSGTEGVGLLVSADKPYPHEWVLPAVAEMLTAGRATDAEAVFARIRAAGLTLRAVVGDDGVLRVTVGA